MDNKEKLKYLDELESKVESAAQFVQDSDWGAAFRQVLKSERKSLLDNCPLPSDEILPAKRWHLNNI